MKKIYIIPTLKPVEIEAADVLMQGSPEIPQKIDETITEEDDVM